MRAPYFSIEAVAISLLALALVGCSKSGLPSSSAADDYTPSTGIFAAIPKSSHDATVINTCNLDTVNDKPAGSEILQHGITATFAGWAADAGSESVPAGVQLMLKGTQEYAVNAATGLSRPDVAKAANHPGWAKAGYSVKADLSAVAPGTYTPVLEFNVNGKPMQCATQHKLTIQ